MGFLQVPGPVFSVFHPPAERLNITPVSRSSPFSIHKSHGFGYGMNSVGAAASKELGVITLSQ